MKMVPGLTENMLSSTNLDVLAWKLDDPPSSYPWEDYNLLNPLDQVPDEIFSNDSSPFAMGQIKRDCMFGKTEDQCLRECGLECDPFSSNEVKHCGCIANAVTACNHSADEYTMVSPQSVLPLQLPYSPLNDHSYHQTTGYPDSEPKQINNSYESESPSDSADEIVDVETVHDIKVEPPSNKVQKKRGRKPAQFKLNSKTILNRQTPGIRKPRNLQQSKPVKYQKRGKASCEPSSASSSEVEDMDKRNSHNTLERNRRDYQKRKFQELRLVIPSVRNNPKASKVMILNEAIKYATELTEQHRQYELQRKAQQKKKRGLQRKVDQLQREVSPQ